MTYMIDRWNEGDVRFVTRIARDRYVQRTLAEYAVAQQNRTPEQIAEQRAEARAAMGPGVEMVNIFTGEKYTT